MVNERAVLILLECILGPRFVHLEFFSLRHERLITFEISTSILGDISIKLETQKANAVELTCSPLASPRPVVPEPRDE